MKVKRYFAQNMRTALDMVKQEQGPDVLILSNRKVDGGVELVTADDLSDQEAERLIDEQRAAARARTEARAQARAASAPARAASATTDTAANPGADAPDAQAPRPEDASAHLGADAVDAARARAAGPSAAPRRGASKVTPLLPPDSEVRDYLWTDAGTVEQMREELSNLKGLLESQLSGLAWSEFGSRHPLRARLLRVLTRMGLCPDLARGLVAEVPDGLDYRDGWHRVLAMLVTRMTTLEDPVLRLGGHYALVGPTGVGKSTLACKLAARYALEFGPEHVAIVSMDDRRLGAHAQMKAFGRLIGAGVHVARDVEELAVTLEDVAPKRLVLIDTPGAAPEDARYRELAEQLGRLRAGLQVYNVMSATTDYLAATKLLNVTADLPIAGCVLTKLDEAATLGPTLSAVVEAKLPLAYTTAGQRVPDDIAPARGRDLIERLVRLAKDAPPPRERAVLERAFLA